MLFATIIIHKKLAHFFMHEMKITLHFLIAQRNSESTKIKRKKDYDEKVEQI